MRSPRPLRRSARGSATIWPVDSSHDTTFLAATTVVLAASFAAALALAALVGLAAGAAGGALVLGAGLLALRGRAARPADAGRRRLLWALGLAGVGAVASGTGVGRAALRLARPDPEAVLDERARALGAAALRSVLRGFHPGRSGDLQLVLAPFNTSNYPHEARSLRPRDPRSSHAMVWPYTDRVPIVVYAPGIVEGPLDRTDEVTLADLAPTAARLMGFDFPAPDGAPLPGLPAPARPPRLIVTFVIDGGGWNVLAQWPDAWPTIRRLIRRGAVYRNGFMGSFPNVTASAHATIGTGAFPRTHGISGHHLRRGGRVGKAYGAPGEADPSAILVPTLAEAWSEHTGGRAWVGEIGYQVWHLGMIGRGRAGEAGEPPVAVYWDEERDLWASQNPDLYRLPREVPPRLALSERLRDHFGEERGAALDAEGGRALCCDPPIVEYQGDLLEAAFAAEPVGAGEATDLLYVNYKAPDYAGHVDNMLSDRERVALEAVDRQLGRLVRLLERRFRPGEFVLIVTADHGQSPLVEEVGGVRLDPIQLTRDIDAAFGGGARSLVQSVRPSEVYLDRGALAEAGVAPEEIAAFLAGYRYGENLGPYVPEPAVAHDRMERREFAAVLPAPYIRRLTEPGVRALGAGRYGAADPGMPPPP